MKLSIKIFLPIILISALLILLNGCFLTPSEEQPAVTLYTVTYDGNENTGGEVPVDANLYKEGDLVKVLGNTGPKPLVNTGYDFYGWNTAADASGTARPVGYVFAMGTSDVTLYAMWDVAPALTLEEPPIGGGGGYTPAVVDPCADNTPPTISNITNTLSVGTPPCDRFGALEIATCSDTYQVETSDPDDQTTLYYELAGEPSGMTIDNSGLITWDPVPCPGTWGVKVRVRDECGDFGKVETYDEVHFQVTSANTPPTILNITNTVTLADPPTPVYNTTGIAFCSETYLVEASDPDTCQTAPLTYSLIDPAPGMTILGNVITWDPPCSGTWDVTVKVKDDCDAEDTVTLHAMMATNADPEILSDCIEFGNAWMSWGSDNEYWVLIEDSKTLGMYVPADDEDECQTLTFSLNDEGGDPDLPPVGLIYGEYENGFYLAFNANCYEMCIECEPPLYDDKGGKGIFSPDCWWEFIIRVSDGCATDEVYIHVGVADFF